MSPSFPTGHPQPPETAAAARPEEAVLSTETGWRLVCDGFELSLSPHTFARYVRQARLVGTEEGLVRLGYPSAFLADQVRDYYKQTFEAELLRVLNRRVQVQLEVVEPESAPSAPVEAEPKAKAKPKVVVEPVGPGEPLVPRRGPNGLDARYTFETFVVGAANQFAHEAFRAVAERPGHIYNPLFLWGGSGLGKTHLMQAVGNKVLEARPKAVVLYTTSEQFTNEVITAIRKGEMESFRRRWRECDVLLIDDVQFLANKAATQEEFFHTFNTLHHDGRQIIVSSDRPAKDLQELEVRLRSRFQWGLSADVQPPEFETRAAILRTKAAAMRLELPDDVVEFLALHIRSNVRELEGALVKVSAFANLMSGRITQEVCKDVLKSVLANGGERVDCEQIIKACADHFKVTVAEIKGPQRTKHLARARHAAMYLAKRITKASYPEIGRRFGGKDHSTVINAVQRVDELMREDADFRKSVETLERELSNVL